MLGKSLPVTSSNTMELNTRLYTHRSDHEIHTPEHRSLAESREQVKMLFLSIIHKILDKILHIL